MWLWYTIGICTHTANVSPRTLPNDKWLEVFLRRRKDYCKDRWPRGLFFGLSLFFIFSNFFQKFHKKMLDLAGPWQMRDSLKGKRERHRERERERERERKREIKTRHDIIRMCHTYIVLKNLYTYTFACFTFCIWLQVKNLGFMNSRRTTFCFYYHDYTFRFRLSFCGFLKWQWLDCNIILRL